MHVFAMLLKSSHGQSDWVRPLRQVFDWLVRYTLYVTMSQASSGPAEHDLMDLSNPLLRDPYITCRYRRHNTPHQPQAPPMTFTFPLHEGLIWAGIKLRINLLLPFSRWESNLITADLFHRTSWYKGKKIIEEKGSFSQSWNAVNWHLKDGEFIMFISNLLWRICVGWRSFLTISV